MRWLAAWRARRERRAELERRVAQAEQAVADAQAQWPAVRRIARGFAVDMRRGMARRPNT